MLVGLNLRKINDNYFDPAYSDAFRTWLLGSSGVNMVYMLSALLAVMRLNVFNGFTHSPMLKKEQFRLPWRPRLNWLYFCRR